MRSKIILFLIILLGLVLRLYKIDIPLADHHSWRQADTAAVARNFIKEGWNFFKPKIDNMVPLHPGKPNNERLFLVEPPIYNSLVAGVYAVLGINVKWARLVSIIFSLGSIVFLFLIASKFFNEKVALLSAFFFAVLPYNIFYSRVVLPEPMIIFFTLGMFWFCIKWLETNFITHYLLFVILSALSFSQKSFPLFLLLPLFYLMVRKYHLSILRKREIYLWVIVSFLPLVLWRFWISQFPEGIPANLWLFNQNNIRFKGAFFYWIFAERIAKLILGYWGLPLLIFGLTVRPKKEGWFFHLWLLSIFFFIFVFAAGNVTHDYYQIPLVPIFCLLAAKGAHILLYEIPDVFNKFVSRLLVIVSFLFAIAFSWYDVRNFYHIQSGVDLAGAAVDQLTPKEALVITGDSNDATLLYNTNRWGWSAGYASSYPNTKETIEILKRQGALIYVTTKFDKNSEFGKYMTENYQIVDETDQFIIFRLSDRRITN